MEFVMLEVREHVALVTIAREKALNALNSTVLQELQQQMEIAQKNSEVRCIIITGAGEKAFVAGADTRMLEMLDVPGALASMQEGCAVFAAVSKARVPVIAAVNGFALGGGCELSMACDIRLASDNAIFGLPETSLGIFPGWSGTQRLPRLVGYQQAARMIFSAERIDAAKAKEIGLVSEVVSQAELLDVAFALANSIAKRAPLAVQAAKKVMLEGLDMPLADGIKAENEAFSQLYHSSDTKAGLHAFNNKEKYAFKGE